MYIYLYVSVRSSFFAEFEYHNTLLILVEISTSWPSIYDILATRIMATHRHLGEFNLTHGDWKCYVECTKQYFTANDVIDDAK